MASRLQVAIYNKLVVDVIVESIGEADRVFARWSVLRWKRNLPIGGAIISSAQSPRVWDVPVGDCINVESQYKELIETMNSGWRE